MLVVAMHMSTFEMRADSNLPWFKLVRGFSHRCSSYIYLNTPHYSFTKGLFLSIASILHLAASQTHDTKRNASKNHRIDNNDGDWQWDWHTRPGRAWFPCQADPLLILCFDGSEVMGMGGEGRWRKLYWVLFSIFFLHVCSYFLHHIFFLQ